MKNVTCEKCEGNFPMNEALKVRDVLVCGACAEAIFKTEKIQRNQVQKQIDPTICIGCGLDNGDDDLAMLGQLPVCPACETLFKNRPFPGWIKTSLAAMVILVLSILAWNSRFIRAYYELRCFASEMAVGDLQNGAPHFISASRLVPENAELQAYGPFYEGLLLLGRDKSAEALKLLQSCVGRVAAETNIMN